MASLSQQQILRLAQKLSPQQIQRIKLLELSTQQLEERVKQEVEENPALDSEQPVDTQQEDHKEISVEEYIDQQESRSYKGHSPAYDRSAPSPDAGISDGESMHDFLMRQLGYRDLTDRQAVLAEYLVGSIDDDGYLRRDLASLADDVAFSLGIETSAKELEGILRIIHQLEPVGIGSRNLRECLTLQLKAVKDRTPSQDTALKILETSFDDFSKRHFEKVMARLNVDVDRFRDACDDIRRLWPKPGNLHSGTRGEEAGYITPDFILDTTGERFELSLASSNLPELRINHRYIEMFNQANSGGDGMSKEQSEQARQFVKEKIDAAKWFIQSIHKRHDTLLRTMRAIVDYQKEYFRHGDMTRLRPMILKDIAEATGLDISTVSRVVNGKYIQTPFGIISLKGLFSEAIATPEGNEVSSAEIKHILALVIEEEDKRNPLNDQQLLDVLKSRGYNITRRTVAKYREAMRIDVARLRRMV